MLFEKTLGEVNAIFPKYKYLRHLPFIPIIGVAISLFYRNESYWALRQFQFIIQIVITTDICLTEKNNIVKI